MYKNNFVTVIKKNGQILREIGCEIYLPFGSQYSILLKNKDSRKAVVMIGVDGENVLMGNNLILDGGESQEIKGFMHDMSVTNRFKFIRKTEEISNHRGDRIDDGLVSVTYTFEAKKCALIPPSPHSDWRSCSPSYKWNHTVYDPMCINFCNNDLYYGTSLTSKCHSQVCEPGITVRGHKVTQEYAYGEIGALENQSYVMTLRLNGTICDNKKVKKSITVKTRITCQTCGRKSKSGATFCYNCGTYLGQD